MSIQNAITAVEEYLSEKLTWKEYKEIREDLIEDELEEEDLPKVYETRGDCLGDKTFLERIDIMGNTLFLSCGS